MADDKNQQDPWLGEPASDAAGTARVTGHSPGLEQRLADNLVQELLAEQRRKRRWGIFFKSLAFIYLFALLFTLWPDQDAVEGVGVGKHTALIQIRGVIADDAEASADNIITGLQSAFKSSNTQAAAVRCRPAMSLMKSTG